MGHNLAQQKRRTTTSGGGEVGIGGSIFGKLLFQSYHEHAIKNFSWVPTGIVPQG